MSQAIIKNPDEVEKELSLKELLLKFKNSAKYLTSRWKTILFYISLGSTLGFAFSIFKKATYKAIATFVVEEGSKGGSLSQYAGLASLAGINLNTEGGGLFEGDNILQLYTSRRMIAKTLLSKAKLGNREILIIDRYIEFNDLRDKWKGKESIANINFNGNPDNFSRSQDSIITDITEKINEKNLYVTKGDKKSTIVQVEFDAKDELFAKIFTEKLVENVNSFYVQTKTKKAADNLNVVQLQADSVRRSLNSSLSSVAALTDAAPNANPNMSSLRVPSQKRQVDVQANSAIYAEVVKNMEIAKMSLLQEKPLIQLIDRPILPLKKTHVGKLLGIGLGGILGGFLGTIIILLSQFIRSVLE